MALSASEVVDKLGLIPHPEGGYFAEVFRAPVSVRHPGVPTGEDAERCAGSLIYFLLEKGNFSAFHRVRWTDEIWHYYCGGAVELHTIDHNGAHRVSRIHGALEHGEPVCVVPAGCWQAARLADESPWALCGCTVAPGFEFADFEMPRRARLLELFPQHARIIGDLTRS